MCLLLLHCRFATPATATRAGILYVSEGKQWQNMTNSWITRVVKYVGQCGAMVWGSMRCGIWDLGCL